MAWDEQISKIEGEIKHPKPEKDWVFKTPVVRSQGNFSGLKFYLLSGLESMTWPNQETYRRLAYLAPLLDYATERGAWVATLNYDLCVEQAVELVNKRSCRGIEKWQESHVLEWYTRDLNLIKLHGSFDWQTDHRGFHHNHEFLYYPPNSPDSIFEPMVLYGEHAKLDPYGPFLDLFMAFRGALERTDRINVIGYSFRDNHVTESIFQWLLADSARVIRVANGSGFSSDQLPKRVRESHYTEELSRRVEICPLKASEAIAEWFGSP